MDAPAVESESNSHTFNLPALPLGRNPNPDKITLIPNRKIGSHEQRRV
jgi:hypothetical protein